MASSTQKRSTRDVDPTTRWVTMTPEWAADLLQNSNHDNRRLRPAKIEKFAGDMKRGQWRKTGEAIKIANTGRLLDGQNRLSACVDSNRSFDTLLIEGLDEDTILHLDTGTPRTRGDVLKFRGSEQWTENVAQVTRLLLALNRGINLGNHTAIASLGDELLIQVAEKWYDEIVYCLQRGKSLQQRIGLSRRVWAGFIFEMRRVDEELAAEFFEKLNTGTNLDPGSPILALREWAARTARNAREKRAPLSDKQFFTAFHKTWNAWVEGETMVSIRHWDRELPPMAELVWKEVGLERKR